MTYKYMSEEEKAKLAEAKEKADADFEAELAELSDEEKVQKRADKKAQELYQSKLDELTEAKKKAETALADKAFKERESKREEHGDEKPITKKEFEETLAKQQQSIQMTLQEQKIAQLVKGFTTSDTEANLVLEILKTRSFPSHLTLDQQIKESVAIANADKLVGERDEAFRALRAKDTAEIGGGSHHDPMKSSTEPSATPQDKQAIQRIGFAWNPTSRRYEKKLPNGKIMTRDEKTGAVTLLS